MQVAPDPDQLARSLTLVLDGGLASGVLDADPAAATAARQTAAQLCPQASELRQPPRSRGRFGGSKRPLLPASCTDTREEPVNTRQPDPDAQLARWQRFRNSRNTALASEYGWLTLTSFQWLEDRPAVELVPGLWSTDGTTAFLTAGRGRDWTV